MIKCVVALAALACLPFHSVAGKPDLPMPIAQQLPVELVPVQQEIGVIVQPNPVGAFGLIGALASVAINKAQVENGEKRVAEIRNLLLDYRFNEQVEKALRAKLANDGISPQPVISLRQTEWDAASPADVLLITPTYHVANTFEAMTVALRVQMVHREIASNGKAKIEIRFGRDYSMNIPMRKIGGSGAGEDAQRWIAMGKPSLERLIDHGIEQTTDMLVYDFSSAGRAEAGKRVMNTEMTKFGKEIYKGRLLRTDGESVWLRQGNDRYQVVTGYHPVDGQPIAEAVAPVAPAAPVDAVAAPATGSQGSP
ncbi:hypothetical protein [Lysobacter antibioticus]|uniref:Uncharacterized protein n=1 Tax=Lysobacter antibioticus TaxID=84531 RepID=A0A0S2FCL9_LYSAN|nr:hypothetical protein [Lysobacter antibioticus]ALN81235.1 hypothetical protein LA76x_3107 [Lysobacter antibioticus]